MRSLLLSVMALLLASSILLPQVVMADDNAEIDNNPLWQTVSNGGLEEIGEDVYGQDNGETEDFQLTIYRLIREVLGFLGIIFVVIIVYAGFRWMTAGGNSEQVSEAQSWMRNAAIGLAIVLMSYSITIFVVEVLLNASQGT